MRFSLYSITAGDRLTVGMGKSRRKWDGNPIPLKSGWPFPKTWEMGMSLQRVNGNGIFPSSAKLGMGYSHPLNGTGWGQRYTIFREWENPIPNPILWELFGIPIKIPEIFQCITVRLLRDSVHFLREKRPMTFFKQGSLTLLIGKKQKRREAES